ncbi:hypothetical protein [Mycolicibacterium sp. S3B2]|uniref:hypothetical protein n=1 Tax=Mycolicibacterium sp. S3B2 TaxID=3415120 RepID=UPI003C7D41B9
MTTEISSNSGYLAIKPETTEGTVADTPDIFVPLYNETFTTELNANTDNSVFGNKFARFNVTLASVRTQAILRSWPSRTPPATSGIAC